MSVYDDPFLFWKASFALGGGKKASGLDIYAAALHGSDYGFVYDAMECGYCAKPGQDDGRLGICFHQFVCVLCDGKSVGKGGGDAPPSDASDAYGKPDEYVLQYAEEL